MTAALNLGESTLDHQHLAQRALRDEAVLQECAWYVETAGGMTHPVGQKRGSPWGLCDMHGQVCEWCTD